MDAKQKMIEFTTDDGQLQSFYIVEQTKIAGSNYLLVTESVEDNAEAYIMKETVEEENQSIYEILDDDTEIEAVSKVFAELLDDIDIV